MGHQGAFVGTAGKGKGRLLTRDDWIEAAVDLMVRTSVEQTRVETLARDLGVSKGSFYWHFRTRDDLLACVLEWWKQTSTADVESELDSVPNWVPHVEASTTATSSVGTNSGYCPHSTSRFGGD